MASTTVPAALEAGSATVPRLGTVPVFVSDQDRALAFYRDALGYRVKIDQPIGGGARWLALARSPGETEILLFRPGMYGEGDELKARVGVWTGMVFLTDDIHATCEALRARGVEVGEEPTPQPWGGWETGFSDPDGNRFQLVQRAAEPFRAGGADDSEAFDGGKEP